MLADYKTAPIDEKLRATLVLLEKMTIDHGNISPDDIRAVMNAGVSKPAIQDALEVAFLFNILDRLADSMGWHVPEPNGGYYEAAARRLLSRGYQ